MYKSLEDLHNEFPWKTYSRFRDLAHRYGFKNDVEIKQFFDEQVMHDQKLKNQFSYQFILKIVIVINLILSFKVIKN